MYLLGQITYGEFSEFVREKKITYKVHSYFWSRVHGIIFLIGRIDFGMPTIRWSICNMPLSCSTNSCKANNVDQPTSQFFILFFPKKSFFNYLNKRLTRFWLEKFIIDSIGSKVKSQNYSTRLNSQWLRWLATRTISDSTQRSPILTMWAADELSHDVLICAICIIAKRFELWFSRISRPAAAAFACVTHFQTFILSEVDKKRLKNHSSFLAQEHGVRIPG